ncbi:uncharacterized protein LOC114719610 [Neltuma alba]|uniref:uncharacterized protein LOC114719610 n=1 Tax=Neltuma alba TaxID=207710 RepID=UPI0010A4D605|nr:uncharacterized protein LOC114719610 [Prosopis alba]
MHFMVRLSTPPAGDKLPASNSLILRNHEGKFIRGFMYNIRVGSAFTAWGILWALKLAWDWNFRDVIIESDCCEVISAVRAETPIEHHDYAVLTEIRGLLLRSWKVELVLCDREANAVADAIAKEAGTLMHDLRILQSLPDGARHLIQEEDTNLASFLSCSG